MKNKNRVIFSVLFVFSMLGLTQFTDGVRSVDVVGLFASGALAGAAITGFFMARKQQ